MIGKNKILITVAAFLIIVLGVVFLGQKGTVVATVSEESAIKDGVKITFSADKYKKAYNVPGSIKLRPGTYTAIAYSDKSALFQQEVIVRNGQEVALVVSLLENPNNTLPGANPDIEAVEKIPYYKLFPHVTGDYRIEALLSEGRTQIGKLRITVIHHFASPTETELYQSERDIALTAAKKWLADNNIPDTIEQEVVDE